MSEYCIVHRDKQAQSPWMTVFNISPPEPHWFDNHYFRVSGTEYHEWSETFKTEFNKEKMWKKLNGTV